INSKLMTVSVNVDCLNSLNNYTKRRVFMSHTACAANDIPQNTLNYAAQSAVYSFALTTTLSGGNVALGLVGAVVGATASLVHGVTTPLFKDIFREDIAFLSGSFKWYQQLARVVVSLSVAAGVAALFGCSLNIVAGVAITALIMLAANHFRPHYPINSSMVY